MRSERTLFFLLAYSGIDAVRDVRKSAGLLLRAAALPEIRCSCGAAAKNYRAFVHLSKRTAQRQLELEPAGVAVMRRVVSSQQGEDGAANEEALSIILCRDVTILHWLVAGSKIVSFGAPSPSALISKLESPPASAGSILAASLTQAKKNRPAGGFSGCYGGAASITLDWYIYFKIRCLPSLYCVRNINNTPVDTRVTQTRPLARQSTNSVRVPESV